MSAFLESAALVGSKVRVPVAAKALSGLAISNELGVPQVAGVGRAASLAPAVDETTKGFETWWSAGTVAGAAALVVGGHKSQRRRRRQAEKAVGSSITACQASDGTGKKTPKEVDRVAPSPVDRALAVNLDPMFYGSFAEIGAGQEVSRWFLRAGAAAGTVARTVSAYDMQMSDRMYGTCQRYVTKERMFQMLRQEYGELEETLREMKGPECRFFSFASTIAAKAFNSDRECEGWLGVMYQKGVGQEPSVIWLHARMSQPTAQLQADALGVLGTNLVYLAWDSTRSEKTILKHLLDDVGDGITINWLSFSGPGWEHVDDRLIALWLVMYGVSEAVVFQPISGKTQLCEAVVPNQCFYKRPLLVQRGRFRFVSKVNEAIFEASKNKLADDTKDSQGKEVLPIIELMLTPIGRSDAALSIEIPPSVERDLISRFNVLSSMRVPILISGHGAMHNLSEYLMRYTNQKVVVAVGGGSYSIERAIFRDSECEGLTGGLLEAFGKIFARDIQMYVFPNIDPQTGEIVSGVEPKSPDIAKNTLLAHLRSTSRIVPIEEKYIPEAVLDTNTNHRYRTEVQEVLSMLCKADERWMDMVPSLVVDTVKKKGIAEVLGTLECAVSGDGGASPVSPLERFSEEYKNLAT